MFTIWGDKRCWPKVLDELTAYEVTVVNAIKLAEAEEGEEELKGSERQDPTKPRKRGWLLAED